MLYIPWNFNKKCFLASYFNGLFFLLIYSITLYALTHIVENKLYIISQIFAINDTSL